MVLIVCKRLILCLQMTSRELELFSVAAKRNMFVSFQIVRVQRKNVRIKRN